MIVHICFTVVSALICILGGAIGTRLLAVTDVTFEYVQELYYDLRNKDPPSNDPTANDKLARLEICNDIFGGGQWSARVLASDPLAKAKIKVPKMVKESLAFDEVTEFVFTCWVKRESSEKEILYYVSKEYNVADDPAPYAAGRFVFGNQSLPRRELIKLAEEPATVFVKDDKFNVELYYLRMRNDNKVGKNEEDPLCKLVSRERRKNQYNRICAKVLNSSYLRASEVKYHLRGSTTNCVEKSLVFRSKEAIRLVGKKTYSERVIPCYYESHSGNSRIYYVSWAYRPYEVFSYATGGGKHPYVEKLITDMHIIRE